MKSIYLAATAFILFGVAANASMDENEVGINVGATSIYNEDSIELDNFSAGVTYQFNEVAGSGIKPRVDLDYVNISDCQSVKGLYKGSVNGVYEFAKDKVVSPYIMAGVGYEHVDGEIKDKFDSNVFTQGGVGVNYHHNDGYDLKLEGKVLQIHGGDNQDNEVIVTAGVSVPIGKFTAVPVETNECSKKIDAPDEDRDGIADVVDQCPGTPCDFTVDEYGCPIKATLRLHFDVDKATIRPYSMPQVEKFATYLVANKGTTVVIDGHTDSDASDAYNMILSEKRATTVVNKLVELGVSSNRLSTQGKGERQPVASNSTKLGKSLNRRIEVKLTYPQK